MNRPMTNMRMRRPMNTVSRPRAAAFTDVAGACVPAPLREYSGEMGRLPLAMAYVPMQDWGETYGACRALCRGTLFPVLDLPFEGVRCG